MEKTNPAAIYASHVFNDARMRERLPKDVYRKLKKTIAEGEALDPSIADTVAKAKTRKLIPAPLFRCCGGGASVFRHHPLVCQVACHI